MILIQAAKIAMMRRDRMKMRVIVIVMMAAIVQKKQKVMIRVIVTMTVMMTIFDRFVIGCQHKK